MLLTNSKIKQLGLILSCSSSSLIPLIFTLLYFFFLWLCPLFLWQWLSGESSFFSCRAQSQVQIIPTEHPSARNETTQNPPAQGPRLPLTQVRLGVDEKLASSIEKKSLWETKQQSLYLGGKTHVNAIKQIHGHRLIEDMLLPVALSVFKEYNFQPPKGHRTMLWM